MPSGQTDGSICEGKNNIKPSFSGECGFSYFKSIFIVPNHNYISLPCWAEEALTRSPIVEFNMSTIHQTLFGKSQKS